MRAKAGRRRLCDVRETRPRLLLCPGYRAAGLLRVTFPVEEATVTVFELHWPKHREKQVSCALCEEDGSNQNLRFQGFILGCMVSFSGCKSLPTLQHRENPAAEAYIIIHHMGSAQAQVSQVKSCKKKTHQNDEINDDGERDNLFSTKKSQASSNPHVVLSSSSSSSSSVPTKGPSQASKLPNQEENRCVFLFFYLPNLRQAHLFRFAQTSYCHCPNDLGRLGNPGK